MKTILLTGGSGLLAVNWAKLLVDTWSVHLMLNKRMIAPFGVRGQKLDLSSTTAFGDALSSLRPDLVVHTAGLTNIESCEDQPQLAHRINVELTANVARCCAAQGIKLVHISTDHIFQGRESFLGEDVPPAPVNTYAQTKVDAERVVAESCPTALVVRTNFYGWGPSYRRSFSDSIIDSLRQGRMITLFQDVFFTPIHVDVLVQTVHALIDQDAIGIFNVVGDERLSKLEFGLNVAQRFGLDADLLRPGSIEDARGLVRRPRDMSLSNKKASDAVGHKLGGIADHLDILSSQESTALIQDLRSL